MEEKRQPVIQVKNLYKIFRVGNEKVRALNGVDLTINGRRKRLPMKRTATK